MNRDEIYDHLAQVYLGKKKKIDQQKKNRFNAWLLINGLITAIIFASATYGLTAFLAQRKVGDGGVNILFSLHRSLMRIEYNFKDSFSSEERLSVEIPPIHADKYVNLEFRVRAKEEGNPGVVKVIVRNRLNEESSFYVRDVSYDWKRIVIPLEKFYQITDWRSLKDISFVLEIWNVKAKKGVILIEDINFST